MEYILVAHSGVEGAVSFSFSFFASEQNLDALAAERNSVESNVANSESYLFVEIISIFIHRLVCTNYSINKRSKNKKIKQML